MRVIHVAPTPFGPDGLLGGGERYPLELARALAADVDCELITFGPHDQRYREPGGLRRQTLQALTHLHGHPAHPLTAALPAALAGADLVHTHHMRSTPSRLAAVTARLHGQPAVVTDHGLQGSDWGGLLPRLFARFLTVSAYSARELGAPPARTRVIAGSTGHDPDLPERDYPQLLHQLAAGRAVDFLGPVPDRELPALYRQAVALALPSVQHTCYGRAIRVSELLGLVALEAMASGTPVVCSHLGGLPEIVQHGVTGFLVEPGDVAELRERLAELLGNPALAARLGRNARELVLARFTWRACAERCLAAYAELLGPAGTAEGGMHQQ